MSNELVPSHNEEPLVRCKALYLGTSIFNSDPKKFNEFRLSLSQLQESISQRYPVDGSNFARGIQTCLSVYPCGIQMEHSSVRSPTAISALFFYPIKSLVYCGALRFVKQYQTSEDPKNTKSWKFVPLDSEIARNDNNIKNPPLFVAFVRGVEPVSKRQIIECHVFIVGMVKTAMSLVESCQSSFYKSKVTVSEFFKKYGNVPVVFCMKDDISSRNGPTNESRMVVKNFDLNGYHYATDQTPIDLWQLFEEDDMGDGRTFDREPVSNLENSINASLAQPSSSTLIGSKIGTHFPPTPLPSSAKSSQILNPYSKTENLVTVEKRVDPVTGNNIYVRYLNPESNKRGRDQMKNYGLHDLIYGNDLDDEECSEAFKNHEYPPIIIRQEKTPSPIIVEKYVKKKSPQVIIKEIHVQEPAPPPIKVVEKMDGSQAQSIFSAENNKFTSIYQSQASVQNGLSNSNIQIQNALNKPTPQQTRFRNMICHTTYETVRGEPVHPHATNNFFTNPRRDGVNNCAPSNYNNMPPVRKPLLKDINYYLNKAENQMKRQAVHEAPFKENHHQMDSLRRPKQHSERRKSAYPESSNRDNYRDERHYHREESYDKETTQSPIRKKQPDEHSSRQTSLRHDTNNPVLSPQQSHKPKSILSQKKSVLGATLKGDLSNRYYRDFMSHKYGY